MAFVAVRYDSRNVSHSPGRRSAPVRPEIWSSFDLTCHLGCRVLTIRRKDPPLPPSSDGDLLFTGKRYTIVAMIKSFRCRDTQKLFETGRSKSFGSIAKVATRKLALLDAAATLEFPRSPPDNRLEALERDRAGQHSIRINDQWRVCFRWTTEGPEDVEIVDYH